MDYAQQKHWFDEAYSLGEKRLKNGYGWPNKVDDTVQEFLEIIQESIKVNNVLDLGCGQGRHTLFYAKKGFQAYGIDYIKRAIDEAKASDTKKAHFKVMDILNLDFPESFFDIVLDWSVLDHIKPKDWDKYLKNILKVLKIGGFLILVEFSANDKRVKGKNYFESDHYDHYFTEKEIKNLFG